jgi:hypothetical protein
MPSVLLMEDLDEAHQKPFKFTINDGFSYFYDPEKTLKSPQSHDATEVKIFLFRGKIENGHPLHQSTLHCVRRYKPISTYLIVITSSS